MRVALKDGQEVCVCECVCVGEREKERENELTLGRTALHPGASWEEQSSSLKEIP